MNGSLKSAAPTEFGNWLEKARRKYVGACVHGSGQFLVRVFDGKNIYLYETFEEATEHTSRDPKFRLEDLSLERVKPCRTIPEPFDVDEMRRERREKKQA
jgi:hypothetical protein